MNRRNFLAGAAALIGGIALEEAIPFGRVWSFPSQIVIAPVRLYTIEDFRLEALAVLKSSKQLRGRYELRAHAAEMIGYYDEAGHAVIDDDAFMLRMDANLPIKFSGVDMRIDKAEAGMTVDRFKQLYGLPALAALEDHVRSRED